MESFEEFAPRREEIMVAGKKLVVEEFNIAKRDAVAKVLLADLKLADLVKPFAEAWRRRDELVKGKVRELLEKGLKGDKLKVALEKEMPDVTINLEELVGQAKEIGLKLLSNDLSMLACVTFDTEENRKRLELDGKDVCEHPVHRFMHSPAMFKWVREKFLPRFETSLLKVLSRVNDLPGLVKNWTALVADTMKAAGEEKKTATP